MIIRHNDLKSFYRSGSLVSRNRLQRAYFKRPRGYAAPKLSRLNRAGYVARQFCGARQLTASEALVEAEEVFSQNPIRSLLKRTLARIAVGVLKRNYKRDAIERVAGSFHYDSEIIAGRSPI